MFNLIFFNSEQKIAILEKLEIAKVENERSRIQEEREKLEDQKLEFEETKQKIQQMEAEFKIKLNDYLKQKEQVCLAFFHFFSFFFMFFFASLFVCFLFVFLSFFLSTFFLILGRLIIAKPTMNKECL